MTKIRQKVQSAWDLIRTFTLFVHFVTLLETFWLNQLAYELTETHVAQTISKESVNMAE